MSIEKHTLYVVATPIGNLGDMTPRAVETLQAVDCIAAEDTRRSGLLLRHFGIGTPMVALHEHNERRVCADLLSRLQAGQSVALISDAGTPLVSDPGYHLVREVQAAGMRVVPVPGPSALLAALCASGLPTDRLVFEGFLPAKSGARRRRLETLAAESRTLAFFEAPHRITDTLEDMAAVFGTEREAVFARELTKSFETIRRDTLGALRDWVAGDPDQRKGEIVVLVRGAVREEREGGLSEETARVVTVLAAELPVKQAAALAAKITGEKKNLLYEYAVQSKAESTGGG